MIINVKMPTLDGVGILTFMSMKFQLLIEAKILKNDGFYPPKELWEAYSNRTVRPSRFVSDAYLLYSLR